MILLYGFLVTVCYLSVNVNDLNVIFDYDIHPSNSTNGPPLSPDKKMAYCAAEYNVTERMMRNTVPSLTEEIKGFSICVAKSLGIMNEDGSLNNTLMDNPNNDKCKNIGGQDQGEIAFNVIKCLGNKSRR